MQRDFNITVYQGRVLLTGASPTPKLKAQAEQIASQVPGVRAVYDEIEVAPSETAWQSAKDTWITAQVRSNLVFDADVRSVNYTIDDRRRLGLSDRLGACQAELDRATDAARYVRVSSGSCPMSRSGPANAGRRARRRPPSAARRRPTLPTAAPRTAVEVQKL